MQKRKGIDIFGALNIGFLSIVNLLHLIWTVDLTVEQLKTGWGFGTRIEMMALLPWMLELICLPVMLAGLVFLILAIFKRPSKGILIANICLFAAAAMQYFLTNLFMFY